MNPSVDLAVLAVAALVLALVFRVILTTRSAPMRAILIVFVVILFLLMISNLHTHGGFHAL
jgi:hypothetical protein